MSIITRFLDVVTETQFKLARDLTAMAFADGEVTPEEREAIAIICDMESIDESRLLEALKGGYENVQAEIPRSSKEKETYLKNLIKVIGADAYSAPQEVFLFQIIASKMGLRQMDVLGLFILATSKEYFTGSVGTKVLNSFLKNYIDPKPKPEKTNREHLRLIYDTVARNTDMSQEDAHLNAEALRKSLAHATEVFLENRILIREFAEAGLNFQEMVVQEAMEVLKRYAG